jgi:hypothetical protein
LPNIKVLKDKDLEFANSIRPFTTHCAWPGVALLASVEESIAEISVELMVGREVFEQSVDYQERSKSASC